MDKDKGSKKAIYYIALLQNACIAGNLAEVYQKEKQAMSDRLVKTSVDLDGEADVAQIREDMEKLEAAYRYFRSPVFTVIAKKFEEANKKMAVLEGQNKALRHEISKIRQEISDLKKAQPIPGVISEVIAGYGFASGGGHKGFNNGGELPPEAYDPLAIQQAADPFSLGSIIRLGIYPYERDGRMSPIEWIILEKYDDNTALVISKYGLDAKPFHTEYAEVSWENCSLRQWLNNTFYNIAFSAREQSVIVDSGLFRKKPEDGDADSQEAGGGDKLFILSDTEADRYLHGDTARRAKPTPYAVQKGAYLNGAAGWWWLRTSGHNEHFAAAVNLEGVIYSYGVRVNSDTEAVRVAMKVNLEQISS